MKSQVNLLLAVIDDYIDHGLDILSKDKDTIRTRADKEGFAFLASTLPTLDDLLLAGLSSGELPVVTGWSSSPGTRLPRFLRGLWRAIFDDDGSILENPSVESIRAIHQISRLYKKVHEVCDEAKVDAAMQRFIEVDRSLWTGQLDSSFTRTFSILFGRDLYRFTRSSLEPSHGPGAVAEKEHGAQKFNFWAIRPQLMEWFDFADFFPKYSESYKDRLSPTFGRVIAVPKTFDKPRLISIEPAATQYAQQAVLRGLDRILNQYKSVQIRDQSRNNALARRASLDGGLSTIDLSDASDRISMSLLRQMMALNPSALRLLEDTRTPAVFVQGQLVPLNKFASMGSACTFPVEVMVFATIAITAMCAAEGDASIPNIRKWLNHPDFGVYGDDIVVPTPMSHAVVSALESLGSVVNGSKSFTAGLFRESCGGDYYAGVPVTPVYVRRMPPNNRHDGENIISWSSLSHQLHDRGLYKAAEYAASLIIPLGVFAGPQPEIGWHDDPLYYAGGITVPVGPSPRYRWNKDLQRHEAYHAVLSHKRQAVEAPDDAVIAHALSGVRGPFTHYSSIVSADPKYITHRARPTSARIKGRWIPE